MSNAVRGLLVGGAGDSAGVPFASLNAASDGMSAPQSIKGGLGEGYGG